MTTSNAPCIRYILLRHAQTNTDAAFMNNDTSGLTVENRHELTFTGKLWCENLLDKDGTALTQCVLLIARAQTEPDRWYR